MNAYTGPCRRRGIGMTPYHLAVALGKCCVLLGYVALLATFAAMCIRPDVVSAFLRGVLL